MGYGASASIPGAQLSKKLSESKLPGGATLSTAPPSAALRKAHSNSYAMQYATVGSQSKPPTKPLSRGVSLDSPSNAPLAASSTFVPYEAASPDYYLDRKPPHAVSGSTSTHVSGYDRSLPSHSSSSLTSNASTMASTYASTLPMSQYGGYAASTLPPSSSASSARHSRDLVGTSRAENPYVYKTAISDSLYTDPRASTSTKVQQPLIGTSSTTSQRYLPQSTAPSSVSNTAMAAFDAKMRSDPDLPRSRIPVPVSRASTTPNVARGAVPEPPAYAPVASKETSRDRAPSYSRDRTVKEDKLDAYSTQGIAAVMRRAEAAVESSRIRAAVRETTKEYANKPTPQEEQQRSRAPSLPKSRSLSLPRGLVGLLNLGNTCFMNSCLQCLSNVPALTEYFITGAFRAHINRSSPSKGEAAVAYADLLQRMWVSGASGADRPDKVKRIVGSIAPRFMGYDQQDAQEFLRFMLDALHDDTNRVTRKPAYKELDERADQSDREVSDIWWSNYCERNDSKCKELFAGELRTVVTCSACGRVSRAFDPMWDLCLPIPKAAQAREKYSISSSSAALDACDIKDCFRSFIEPERISDVDGVYCSRCKKHQACSKAMTIFRLPEVLVIQLKRFTFSTFRRTKLSTAVSFPTTDLDLSAYCDSSPYVQARDAIYDLVGVSNHSGSLGGGHYTAYVLSYKVLQHVCM
jgi:ubiquitin C-terminal hydrolase